MRLRFPPYLLLLLAACAGTEVGNPTFACGGSDEAAGLGGVDGEGGYAGGGSGGTGPDRSHCSGDGSDCGLAASLDSFADAACPGGTSRTQLWLGNLTDAPITGSVQVSDDATVQVIPDHFALEPHGETVLAVVFAPPTNASAGADGATLRIVIDGDPPGELEVRVSATVDPSAPPALGVLCGNDGPCPLLDFGEVEVGATAEASFTVVNDGCDELSLLPPELSGDGQLALVEPPSFPVAVPPRGLVALRVAFTPAAVGPVGGTLILTTEVGDRHEVPWQGSGR